MQPYTLQQTLVAVEQLNKQDQPFTYRVEGNQIVGEWKYLDAVWAGVLAAGNIDKDFRVTVDLDETAHTYTTRDHQSQSASNVGFSPGSGQISFGKSAESFSGHAVGKDFGFGFGHAKQPQNQTVVGGPTYKYNFDTSQIKTPLFNFLAQTGWQKGKTSFFGKIFGSK